MRRTCQILGSLLLTVPVGMAAAGGARIGVEPRHGEMVLLRDVNARPAYRPAPPSIALIVDPTPNAQLLPALADGELSDADFEGMSTGNTLGSAPAAGSAVEQALQSVGLGGGSRGDASSSPGLSAGPAGAVGATTSRIGGTVTGALSAAGLLGGRNGGGP